KLVAALGDQADAAPLAVADLEDVLDQPARLRVAGALHGPAVLVLDLGPPGFQLPHGPQHAFEQVERLEASYHNWNAVAAGDRLVLGHAHDGADVAGTEERLDAVAGRLQDRGNHRRHEHVRDQYAEIPQTAFAGHPPRHR